MISLCFMPAWHSLSPSECLLASAIPEVALWVPCVIKPLLSAGSIWASHRTSRTQWTGQGRVATRVATAHPAGMSVLMGTRARQGEHSAPGFLPLTELHTEWNKTYGLVPAGPWFHCSAACWREEILQMEEMVKSKVTAIVYLAKAW